MKPKNSAKRTTATPAESLIACSKPVPRSGTESSWMGDEINPSRYSLDPTSTLSSSPLFGDEGRPSNRQDGEIISALRIVETREGVGGLVKKPWHEVFHDISRIKAKAIELLKKWTCVVLVEDVILCSSMMIDLVGFCLASQRWTAQLWSAFFKPRWIL